MKNSCSRWEVVTRWAVALLFIWAAISKLANPSEFLGSIYAYELAAPQAALKLLAASLPWIELLSGLFLVAHPSPRSALFALLILVLTFLAATGQAWARGLSIDCGCLDLSWLGLDVQSPLYGTLHSVELAFGRNLLLAALLLLLLRLHPPTPAPDQSPLQTHGSSPAPRRPRPRSQ